MVRRLIEPFEVALCQQQSSSTSILYIHYLDVIIRAADPSSVQRNIGRILLG